METVVSISDIGKYLDDIGRPCHLEIDTEDWTAIVVMDKTSDDNSN